MSALCALVGLCVTVGCTCNPAEVARQEGRQTGADPRPEDVTIEVGTEPGPLPVTIVLDPSGALCLAASRRSAGKRHVLCDQTDEDLAAAKLRDALRRLKKEVGSAVAPAGAWVLATAAGAPVARALSVQEPTFFSRVAVWVGDSPAPASLFGPGYWHEVGRGTLHAVVLAGPGAAQADTWTGLAERQGVHLRAFPAVAGVEDPALWAAIDREFGRAVAAP